MPETISTPTQTKLNSALTAWCERNCITARNLADKCGYDYQHAYRLRTGAVPVTPETIGRFVLGFGLESTREVLDMAGMNASLTTIPHPIGAMPVPMMTIAQAQ